MTRFVGTPLRGVEFSSPSDEAVSTRVNGDGHARIRIDAGGRITWSAGSSAGDTNLYRDGENTLTTDDVFKATGGLVTLSTDGAPTVALPNGALAIDTTNNVFYFRSDNVWNQVTGGGGASVEIGDTPPLEPNAGDIWFESDTGSSFVYYDSSWVEIGGMSAGGATVLDGLSDVVLTSPTSGQVLKFNGTNWVNDADDAGTTINSLDDIGDVSTPAPASGSFLMWDGFQWKDQSIELGNNTTGNYVSGVTAGTGVTVTHTPGEGSSAEIAIGQAVGTTDSVTFDNVNVSTNVILTGGGSISSSPSTVDTGGTITISPEGIMSGTAISGGSVNILAGYAYGLNTVGGDVTIDAGDGMPLNGQISIGTTYAESVSIGLAGKNTTVNGGLIVSGDLTVNGTTTTVNTENLLVEDNVITLNSNAPGPTVVSAGIEVYRGSGEFVPALRWNETNDKWEITTDGTNYDAIQTATPFNALEQKVKNQMVYLMCEVGP